MARQRIVLSKEQLVAAVGDRWSDADLSEAAELLLRADGRFPPGVRTVPAELVRAVQRERLLAGMVRAAAERGYGALTVQDVLDFAGISRPTFYEFFKDKEACFLAAVDTIGARLRASVGEAAGTAGPDWRGRLRAGLAELLRFAGEETEAARTLIVEARASTPAGVRRRDELLESFAECLDETVRPEMDNRPSALAAAGVVGGIESVVYTRLQRDEAGELESLLPSLMYFAVLAYAGKEAAAEEFVGGVPV